MKSKRSFKEGSIFGITDIIYERNRLENFIADKDSSLLVYERGDFLNFLNEFPDIDEEVKVLAQGRDELIQAVLKEQKAQEEAKRRAQKELLLKRKKEIFLKYK